MPQRRGGGATNLGGARARRAARLGARARKGRPRATAFSPAAAQPLLAAAGARRARAFPRYGRRRGRHMPSAAPRQSARRGAGRPRPRAEPLAAPRPKVSAAEAVSRRGRLRGEAVAELACQRRCESAPTLPRRDSPRLGYRDTSTTLLRHGADAGQREQALLSPLGRGLPGLAGAEGCPSRGPEPGAVRDQPRQGGCSCARECGLPPRQLGRARQPAGITCSRPPPAPRSAQPRLHLSRCSWRPLSGRSRRAAAAAAAAG